MWRSGAPQRRVARGAPKGRRCTYVLLYAVAPNSEGDSFISKGTQMRVLISISRKEISDPIDVVLVKDYAGAG